jgi:8-oxo-dGTP pyrophosphatase MutT (NUDIX family)
MPANKISVDRAKTEKLFYFVANVMVVRRSDMRCMILKRHEREKVHPGRYATTGGKLEWRDLDLDHPTRLNGDVIDFETAVDDLLAREAFEEAGIKLKPGLAYINSVAFVRPDGVPVVMVKFAAEYLSGKIVLEEGGFTDYAWVNAEEVKNYPCIDGIDQEVAAALELFS